jgi:branched-chain amino acid transport system substrate-binding protein
LPGAARLRAICLLGLAVLGAACAAPFTSSQLPLGQDIIIGIPLSFTGSVSREGAIAKRGYDLWLDWVNGRGGIRAAGARHRVRVIYEDDQSKPALAGQLAEKFIKQDHARFLLGPYGSSNTVTVAAVADHYHVPLISANGSSRVISGYSYVFNVQTPAPEYLPMIFDLAASLQPRPTTVAFLTADDFFSLDVTAGAFDHAVARGFDVVFRETYPNGSTNFSALVAQAKARNPDILVNAGHFVEAVALIKAAKDGGLNAKMFAASVGPALPDFVQQLGPAADYVLTSSQWTVQAAYKPSYYLTNKEYVSAYRKKYRVQDDPSYQAADATAAGVALQKAIENADSLDPDKVRDALVTLDVITFFGRIKFSSVGQNSYKPMLIEQIQHGSRFTVWPPERSSAPPLYPAPPWTAR